MPPTEANERTGESTPAGDDPLGPGEPLGVGGHGPQPPSTSATFGREVGEHEVGARPLEHGQLLERDGRTVDPTGGRGRLHHGELATHVVRRQGHGHLPSGQREHVERRHGRLDHDHVGALGHVLRNLGQRLAEVARVLLVGPPVASAGDRHLDRVAERAVEGRRVLRGVRQDRDLVVSRPVERGADGGDLAVHHPARCHDVGARIRLGHGDALVQLERGVVQHLARWAQHATVSMVGVLVETEVGHQHQLVTDGGAQGAQCHLHHAVGIPGPTALRVLALGDAEEDQPGNAK